MRLYQAAFGALSTATLVACQTANVPEPAVLERADTESLARLQSALASAMGKARVEIGAADLETSPEIPVLPPRPSPFEGQSPALPTYFDLATKDGACLVIERSTGNMFDVSGLRCMPAGN